MNVSNEQILAAYNKTKSIWKSADMLGIKGQYVHARLKLLGVKMRRSAVSEEEREIIREIYSNAKFRGDIDIKSLSEKLGMAIITISRCARTMGLTTYFRPLNESDAEKTTRNARKNFDINGHPRGALGMKHTNETKEKMAESSRKMWANMDEKTRDEYSTRASINGQKAAKNREGTSWKAGWREIGGIKKYYRSRWEANYARYLEWLKKNGQIKSWEHEPETFWFEPIRRGCRSYLPDFRVTENNGNIVFHEVKGWMDDRSITKIKRMAKYHPNIKLIIIDAKQYKAIEKSIYRMIPDWEFKDIITLPPSPYLTTLPTNPVRLKKKSKRTE